MPETRPELGQFFTPRPVIDFALQVLADLGAEIPGSTVCDPACGPGEWLRIALDAGASEALGIDCDPEMIALWRESGLATDTRCRLLVADGLSPDTDLAGRADLVLGNPPFGAELSDLRETTLDGLAAHYRLPGLQRAGQQRLFRHLSNSERERMRRFPTEVLFLERFVEVCRPGGWIAIVLPEGIFANRRWLHVREWLLGHLTVHVVAALPRGTFRAHATTARTCLLLMRREPPPIGHDVVLAQADECTPRALSDLRRAVFGESAATPEIDLTPPIFTD